MIPGTIIIILFSVRSSDATVIVSPFYLLSIRFTDSLDVVVLGNGWLPNVTIVKFPDHQVVCPSRLVAKIKPIPTLIIIFTISLEWINFKSPWIIFEGLHDVSASQLGASITWCFGSRELSGKQELVVDLGQLVSLFWAHASRSHCRKLRINITLC